MSDGQNRARIDREAAEWHALIEADDMDWEGFADWLDADPVHRRAYDLVASLDAEVTANRVAIAAFLPANDDIEPVSRSRGWWVAGAVAVLTAMIAFPFVPKLLPAKENVVAWSTGPNEMRAVALRDGSTIKLDRNTRLTVHEGADRHVELASGSAFFDVRHDAARPFTVVTGGYQVRDIGTRFELSRNDSRLTVAVAQGEVGVGPIDGPEQSVVAGQRIDLVDRDTPAQIRSVAQETVGSWRDGRLIYDNAPLTLVAADASRYAGVALTVDPAVAGLHFSGVLTIGDGSHLVEQLQDVLPIKARRQGGEIRFVAAPAR